MKDIKFNKEEFANLINLAMGNRSQNGFALSCDISPSHLSRLRRCLLDTPPSPTIIRNMAKASQGRVAYEDFMHYAGYIEAETDKDKILEALEKVRSEIHSSKSKNILEINIEGLNNEDIEDIKEYVNFKRERRKKN